MDRWSAEPSSSGAEEPDAPWREVLDALEAVLEEGVPRRALTACAINLGVAGQWAAAFAAAECAVAAEPCLTRLVACATAIDALVDSTGVDIATVPALAGLRATLRASRTPV